MILESSFVIFGECFPVIHTQNMLFSRFVRNDSKIENCHFTTFTNSIWNIGLHIVVLLHRESENQKSNWIKDKL